MVSVRSISLGLVVDIGTEMDNDVVERRLNACVSSFISHVRIVVAKKERVEREA